MCDGRLFPFPPRTRGFLYFKSEAELSPLAGAVRFRITPTDSPSSFSEGEDLLWPSGCPWQVMLAQIAVRTYPKIRDQLLREKLVTSEQIAGCISVFGARRAVYPQCTIFHMKESFVVDFSSAPSLSIVGTTEMRSAQLQNIFCDIRGGTRYYAYEGAVFLPCSSSVSPA